MRLQDKVRDREGAHAEANEKNLLGAEEARAVQARPSPKCHSAGCDAARTAVGMRPVVAAGVGGLRASGLCA